MSIGTGLNQLQKTIYSILNNDSQLQNLVTGVFDEIRPKQPFPYIALGDFNESNMHTFDREGREINIEIHIFSDYRGNKEIFDILSRVLALIDHKDIEIEGLHSVFVRYNNGNIVTETGGPTTLRHFVGDFLAMVQEVA